MPGTRPLLRAAFEHHQSGRLEQAEGLYRQVLLQETDNAQATHLLGMVLHQSGRLAGALALMRRALEVSPAVPDFHNNLGVVLHSLGRLSEAETCHRAALRLKPAYAECHYNLANVLREAGRAAEAVQQHLEALRLRPGYFQARRNLAAAYGDLGMAGEAVDCLRQAVALRPDSAAAHSDLLVALHYPGDLTPEELFREHVRWAARHAEPLCASARRHDYDPDPGRPLRVGFVSPDFREHPVARFAPPLLANLDRARFVTVCYSDATRPDEVTARLRACCAEWRDTARLPHDRLAEQVRADRIDILVDLTGHMAGNRLPAFARRPAPVQVTQFNYPNTTGMTAMDYRVTDAYADPPGRDSERLHAEQLVRLPDCAWCYAPADDAPPVGELPALAAAGRFTFGSMNNAVKVTPTVLALWCRVLAAVPGSRLLFLGGDPDYVRAQLAEHGVDPARLDPVPRTPRARYLALFNRVDIALDPFPYNGGVSTCDALWMGVPVVTLAGDAYVSRQGLMLLSNLGLTDLIARTPDEYLRIAASLAGDPAALRALRSALRARVAGSAVADGAGYAQKLGRAYRAMWVQWCRDQAGPAGSRE